MDFKTWLMVALSFIAIVTADPARKEPQKEAASNTESKSTQTKQKRENNYELKDMIVYLTPTQIKAIESGKAVLEPQYTYTDSSSQNQYQKQRDSNENNLQRQNDQIQNSLHQEGQEIQRQIENLEANRKARLQLQEQKEADPEKDLKSKQVIYSQEQRPKQYQEYQQQSERNTIQTLQEAPKQEHYNPIQQQLELQSIPQFEQQQSSYPQLLTDNYAYQYSYPKGKEINSDNLHLFFPEAHQPKLNEQLLIQHQQHETTKNSQISPKFHLVPYQYNRQAQLEAQTLLENQWAALATQQLDVHRAEAQENESQQLKEVHQQLNSAQVLAAQHQDETHQLQAVAQQLEADQYEAIRQHSEQVLALQKKAVQQIKDFQKEIKEQDQRQKAQQNEAQRLDEELEKEEFKAEVAKAEDKFYAALRNQESEKNQYLTILAPLLRHDQIKDSFKLQKNNLWNYPKLEGGFKPLEHTRTSNDHEKLLQYAPSYNEDKFAKVLKESLHKNEYEKAKAIAKAEAISREQPVVVHQEVKVTRPIQVVKHVKVPVPQPFYVPIPSPFEVKVPQPYPVPLEIIRHVPVPVVKTEKIEVEKPVPVEVEKHVPVPVTKNVYIPVDKPYIVERIVPVEVKKEVPVEKVVHRPQKYTIVKHVWNH